MVLNPFRTGAAVGAFLGLWHLLWSSLVALGWAQAVIDFILRLHFLRLAITTAPFDAGVAAQLVGLTAFIGFVAGAAFATLWNWLHRSGGA